MSRERTGPPLPRPKPRPLKPEKQHPDVDVNPEIDHSQIHLLRECDEVDIANLTECLVNSDKPRIYALYQRLFPLNADTLETPVVYSGDWSLLHKILNLLWNHGEDVTTLKSVKQAAPSMNESQVQFHLRCIAGRVLTLVDALVADPTQRKAFKTYVKKEFREEFSRVAGKFMEQRSGCGSETGMPEEYAVAEAEFGR